MNLATSKDLTMIPFVVLTCFDIEYVTKPQCGFSFHSTSVRSIEAVQKKSISLFQNFQMSKCPL